MGCPWVVPWVECWLSPAPKMVNFSAVALLDSDGSFNYAP